MGPSQSAAAAAAVVVRLRVASLRLLVRLLTCGLPLPTAHFALLNGQFAEFLLRLMTQEDADDEVIGVVIKGCKRVCCKRVCA